MRERRASGEGMVQKIASLTTASDRFKGAKDGKRRLFIFGLGHDSVPKVEEASHLYANLDIIKAPFYGRFIMGHDMQYCR